MEQTPAATPISTQRVECLDGMRGLAALWVLVGHTMMLTGFNAPIASQPDLGVDLFIMLSGFLMVYQYQKRSSWEDWSKPKTILAFWMRRFFRLAPLYYALLAIALIAGPAIYEYRLLIDSSLGRSAQAPSRYLDAGALNIASHMTFTYGFLPSHAFRTPLPDWSLGLEMQFYMAFPFIVLGARRLGWLPALVITTIAGVAIAGLFQQWGIVYPMPSLLPLKLHFFVAGMVIAAALVSEKPIVVFLAFVIVLVAIPIGGGRDLPHLVVRETMAVGFFALVLLGRVPVVAIVGRALGSKPFHWLGELSFGVYLLHLLILQPVAGWLLISGPTELSAVTRFLVVFCVVAPLSYLGAYIGYRFVELPGQAIGKRFITLVLHSNRAAISTPAERVAAP